MILIVRGLDQEVKRRDRNKGEDILSKEVALFSFEGTTLKDSVAIAKRSHPFPSRTRKLSSFTSTILGGRPPGKIDSCRNKKNPEIVVFSDSYHMPT